ncbi:DUF262 domain-containing protein [Campylobacter curvus]|uniref:DUF262 domain-containing protein n=1 Tax=Campylobacter curvus TaxID=200 RepID=UPI00147031B6|nr:DUF262 domain-containing protein [Campylobacter curvus]
MPNNFSRNSIKISDIYSKFNNEEWIIDKTYQRRKVWGIKDNIRLIETILLELVIPEIFIWDCDTDPTTGKTITHIVDGQQRINAIFEFIQGKFKLQSKYLISPDIQNLYGDLTFSQLPDDIKKRIWIYEISVVNLNNTFSLDEIKNMFYRLNLTDYSLNEQEKRNSMDSVFGKAAESLADSDFWTKHKVFSPKDVRRMGDVEYCSSILLLCREGIVDQTKQETLDQLYTDFVDEYPDRDKDLEKVNDAINYINAIITPEIESFSSKKIQMFTLFALAFDFIDNEILINDEIKKYFVQFVKTYNAFKNEYEFPLSTEEERKVFEMIKKYKLASSEGVNKISNRMIRFEVLKKILLNTENIDIKVLTSIEKKCNEQAQE